MKKNKKAYSIIIALLMVGFLLVVVVGVFNLVLKELNDNRGMGNYIKAFFGAEAGQELALLQIKEKGYGYSDKIDLSINNRSIILSDNPADTSLFKGNNDVLVSYDIPVKTNSYTGILSPMGYDIIPLYYLSGVTIPIEEKINDLDFNIIQGNSADLVWNIIGKDSGFSGTGAFDGEKFVDIKSILSNEFVIENKNIKDFLNSSTTNFLILLNSGVSDLTYNLSSVNINKYFSKPRTKIFSSSLVGNYRQNLSTDFDNTEYLKILKYSIYSN